MKCSIPPLGSSTFGAVSTVLLSFAFGLALQSQTTEYTLDADFQQGILFNVNLDTPDQLGVSTAQATFPFLYIANAGDDTVSKINSDTNLEVARYRTFFSNTSPHGNSGFTGPAPSRTAVDSDGNCYVANRGFGSQHPGHDEYTQVIKILASGGIDRDGNGSIETSTGPADLKDVIDDGANGGIAGDGILQIGEFRDERIAWVTELPHFGGLGRSLSIDPDGNIWVGLYSTRVYYKLDGATGAILLGPISTTDPSSGRTHTPYGSLVDQNGILWGASLTSNMLEFNTNAGSEGPIEVHPHSGGNYGIGIARDPNLGHTLVFLASAANPFLIYDSSTDTFTDPVDVGGAVSPPSNNFGSLGISADQNADVYISGSKQSGTFGFSGAAKFDKDGNAIWSSAAQPGMQTSGNRGAVLDANGDVWAVGTPGDLVAKHDGTTGAPLGTVQVGNYVYTYSDASGSTFVFTNPFGTWTIVHDTGAAGTDDCTISWTGDAPLDSTIEVEVEASDVDDEPNEFNLGSLTTIANGDTAPAGRYILIRVTLTPGQQQGADPVLFDLSVVCPVSDICGDLDNDGDVDVDDRNILIAALNSASGDPGFVAEADYDQDGLISYSDYREWYKCYRLFLAGQI